MEILNKNENHSNVHKILNLDKLSVEKKIKKILLFIYLTLDGLSNDKNNKPRQ